MARLENDSVKRLCLLDVAVNPESVKARVVGMAVVGSDSQFHGVIAEGT